MQTTIQKSNNRIAYVDFMKSLGMLIIIWGHIMLSGITNAMAYAFHIPLFFFLSGLMFKSSKYPSFKEFFVKRVKSLLIPYVIFSFLTWCLWAGYSYFTHAEVTSYFMPLLQTVIAQGSGGFLIHNVPLWFVTCLFVVECLYFFIAKLSFVPKIIVCILCGAIGAWMTLDNTFFDFRLLPWNLEVALAAIPFYALGNLMIEHYSHDRIVKLVQSNNFISFIIFILSFFLLWLGASYNGSVSMGSTHLNNFFIFYATAVFGIVMMLILCVWLSSLNHNFLWKFTEWFGRNSFTSMAIHNPIKGIVVVIVAKFMGGGTTDYVSVDYKYSIVAFVLSLIITCMGVIVVNCVKKKLKLL